MPRRSPAGGVRLWRSEMIPFEPGRVMPPRERFRTIVSIPAGWRLFRIDQFISIMKKILIITFIACFINAFSQQERDSVIDLDEILLKSTRVHDRDPFTHTDLKVKKIESLNLGQDLPVLLSQMPSVVTTSDAGAGVGYTGMRVRGSDATRVNVTLNGIPFNDAESHGTYWVDLPDFISSVDDIQLQRGIGTSTNGAAAFGATMSLKTGDPSPDGFAATSHSYGSFNTRKHNIRFGSGIHNGFYAQGRLSRIYSDGYIDRAFSDLKSFFTEAGYTDEHTQVKALFFGGHERTYQAWYGTPECIIDDDPAEIEAFIERNYLNDDEAENLRHSGRTYNYYTYENQVDDYLQNHYQLHFSRVVMPGLTAQISLNYTYGTGYYEQYKDGEYLSEYFNNSADGEQGDVVRRKWLANDFYAMVYSLNYKNKKIDLSFGGGYNRYEGRHFGKIIWDSFPSAIPTGTEYYRNKGDKDDFNTYLKTSLLFDSGWRLSGDVQIRTVNYKTTGITADLLPASVDAEYVFFNPKAGISYQWNRIKSAYLSAAIGHREPNRDDLVKNPLKPVPEKMLDIETGYRTRSGSWYSEVNFYFMGYRDQLVLTGALDDVGDPIRQNVKDSYRTGIEWQGTYNPGGKWAFTATAAISRNKISSYDHYVYDTQYDPATWETVSTAAVVTTYHDTDISFSPPVVAGGTASYHPWDNLELKLISKYVGKQYLDNTSNDDKSLDPYWVNNLNISYSVKTSLFDEWNVYLLFNNILNRLYESNGYTYSYYYRPVGSQAPPVTENFYYPQAGFHLIGGVSIKL